MAKLKLSYVHGASDKPLLGETIGQFFDAACAKWAARPALVVRHQKVRMSYGELRAAVDKLAAGLLTLGLHPGDRIGIWSPNNSEWVLTQFATAKAGLILVNINPSYRVAELEYALNKVGCKALILAEALQDRGLCRHAARACPRTRRRDAWQARGRAAAVAALDRYPRRGRHPGSFRFSEILARGGAAEAQRLAELAPLLQFDEPINIQFTSGTTGLSQGRDALASQHPQQRLLHRRGDAADAGRPIVHPGAALSLLRHGFGQSCSRHPRRLHGLSRRRFRSAGHAGNRGRGALHGAARRADDVHRRARSSGIRPLRPLLAAHRHHGGLALSRSR